MSPKVNDGLSWVVLGKNGERFLLKRPLPIGGWYFLKDLSGFYRDLNDGGGWGWGDFHDKENEGAALVAPLSVLFWEKE